MWTSCCNHVCCRCVIQRLLPFTQFQASVVRRGGVIGTLRNCCFDHSESHTEASWDIRFIIITDPHTDPDSIVLLSFPIALFLITFELLKVIPYLFTFFKTLKKLPSQFAEMCSNQVKMPPTLLDTQLICSPSNCI